MRKSKYVLNGKRLRQNGSIAILPDTLDNIDCIVNNIKINFNRKSVDKLELTILSEENNISIIENMFFDIYDYMAILFGYFPEILECTYLNISNIVETHKTSERYIISQTSFIKNIDSVIFKESFTKFQTLKSKLNFQLDYYFYAISYINDHYPEFPIVNTLQNFDGIYNNLSFTKSKRCICSKKTSKIVKEKINDLDFNELFDDSETCDLIKKSIKDKISRFDEVDFDTKLTNIFDYIDEKFKIFNFEKFINEYKNFIIKCKHTRNKFSHSSNINKCFNGSECVFYMFKLSLVFRLLIIDEINLSELVDIDLLNYELKSINERLNTEVYKSKEALENV